MQTDVWLKEAREAYGQEIGGKIDRVLTQAKREMTTRDKLIAEQAEIIRRYSALCDEAEDALQRARRIVAAVAVWWLVMGLLAGALIW